MPGDIQSEALPLFLLNGTDERFRYYAKKSPDSEYHMRFWDKETLLFSADGLPRWMRIDPDTGVIHGNVPPGSGNSFPVKIKVKSTVNDKITGEDEKSIEFIIEK